MALTGNAGNSDKKLTKLELKNIQKKRKSDVVWMNDRWIYKEIQPYIHQANSNAGWNFDWDWSESCQFTEYKKDSFMIGIATRMKKLITPPKTKTLMAS